MTQWTVNHPQAKPGFLMQMHPNFEGKQDVPFYYQVGHQKDQYIDEYLQLLNKTTLGQLFNIELKEKKQLRRVKMWLDKNVTEGYLAYKKGDKSCLWFVQNWASGRIPNWGTEYEIFAATFIRLS